MGRGWDLQGPLGLWVPSTHWQQGTAQCHFQSAPDTRPPKELTPGKANRLEPRKWVEDVCLYSATPLQKLWQALFPETPGMVPWPQPLRWSCPLEAYAPTFFIWRPQPSAGVISSRPCSDTCVAPREGRMESVCSCGPEMPRCGSGCPAGLRQDTFAQIQQNLWNPVSAFVHPAYGVSPPFPSCCTLPIAASLASLH